MEHRGRASTVEPATSPVDVGGRRTRRLVNVFAAPLCLLALVTGCTAPDPAPPEPTSAAEASATPGSDRVTTVTADDGSRLLVAARPETAGDSAGVFGELVRTDGDCVGLRQESDTFTVIWPHGTVFDEPGGIEIAVVGAVRFGDHIPGGGGGYYDAAAGGDELFRDTIESCATGGRYAIIHFLAIPTTD
jgi:hypothetical protein